jgi:predicted esterase
MVKTTDDEHQLIATMQRDVADMKALMRRVRTCALGVMKICNDGGRQSQANDALIWAGAIRELHGKLEQAHGTASHALIRGFDNGGEIVAMGPGR